MVDVRASNQKLIARAMRLTQEISGCGELEARTALVACDYRVKTAVVMIACDTDAYEAESLLRVHDGNLRACLRARA
jgi:N-acetylmuramic acid 6-phosphate etherase